MKKFVSVSSKKTLKRQLIGGGVYIALSAVAVAVTVNTAVSLLSKNTPIADNDVSLSDTDIKIPSLPEDFFVPEALPKDDEITVSDLPSGIDSLVIENEYTGIQGDEALSENNNDGVITESLSEAVEEEGLTDNAALQEIEEIFSDETGENKFIKPCEGFISAAHSLDIPVYSPTFGDFRTHGGVDIAADKGAVVKAAGDGKIAQIYEDDMLGNTLVLECDGGYRLVYANLAPTLPEGIETDAEISVGTVLGCVGDSSIGESAQESHLHLEILKDGMSVNPEELIDF